MVRIIVFILFVASISPVAYASDEQYYSDVKQYSDAELAQMLAPVALYPDTLLTHVLIASTYPLEIVEAHRWRKKYRDLPAARIMDKADDSGWDPSVVALLPFEHILTRMHDDLSWTQDLGNAFLTDEEQVLEVIQDLRKQAERAGSLSELENVSIKHKADTIIIEPVRTKVVYVPVYDSRVIYGHWRWHRYPPVYWHHDVHYYHPVHWISGVHIAARFYFSAFHWHNRHIIVDHHHYYSRPSWHRHSRVKRHHILKSDYARAWRHDVAHRRGVHYVTSKGKSRAHHVVHHNKKRVLNQAIPVKRNHAQVVKRVKASNHAAIHNKAKKVTKPNQYVSSHRKTVTKSVNHHRETIKVKSQQHKNSIDRLSHQNNKARHSGNNHKAKTVEKSSGSYKSKNFAVNKRSNNKSFSQQSNKHRVKASSNHRSHKVSRGNTKSVRVTRHK